MTDHNARQAGLTDEQINVIYQDQIKGRMKGDGQPFHNRYARAIEKAVLAAHSADARNEDSKYLGQLLARIHRDGGQYQSEHGTAKAVADADVKVARMNVEAWVHADARNGEGVALTDGWLQSGGLLYRLTDERRPQNRDEINVTMANGSREDGDRAARASELLAILAAPAAPAPKDAEILQVIDERDAYHEIADGLAAQIATITDVEIGEHSSVNNPWRNAMLAADDFIAKQLRKLLAGPSAPAPAAPDDQQVRCTHGASPDICTKCHRYEGGDIHRGIFATSPAPKCDGTAGNCPNECSEPCAPVGQLPAAQADSDFPLGAVENGRAYADRLEAYQFESEGGTLRLCSDWQEFRRCFEYMAQYLLSRQQSATPVVPAVNESALTAAVWQRICELPDRNSPEGEPDACVLTLREFSGCMANGLEDLNLLPPQGISPADAASEADKRDGTGEGHAADR